MLSEISEEQVQVHAGAYPVVSGYGLIGRIDQVVQVPADAEKALVFTAPPVARYYEDLRTALRRRGLTVHRMMLPDGEMAKSLRIVSACYERLARLGVGRGDLVVGLGGGTIMDLTGFVASTWNRGIALVNVSTTLLGHVDASFGGKTAINLKHGKNLVGTFHHPVGVVADLDTLHTLPDREVRSGLAEIVKCGFIGDRKILDDIHGDVPGLRDDPARLFRLIRRSIGLKARLVQADESDSDLRQALNYGHTVGQAIEALTGFTEYRHGEAVGLGMLYAARLGELLGVCPADLTGYTRALLAGVGLPVHDRRLSFDAVWPYVRRDKKARRSVRFVVAPRLGTSAVIDCDDLRAAKEAFDVFH